LGKTGFTVNLSDTFPFDEGLEFWFRDFRLAAFDFTINTAALIIGSAGSTQMTATVFIGLSLFIPDAPIDVFRCHMISQSQAKDKKLSFIV
jgi:hypothetical protein